LAERKIVSKQSIDRDSPGGEPSHICLSPDSRLEPRFADRSGAASPPGSAEAALAAGARRIGRACGFRLIAALIPNSGEE
jgi:hypothetical protein